MVIHKISYSFGMNIIQRLINTGISTVFGLISSVPIIHIVLYWICLVRSIVGEKVLYEAVQFVCLDPCGIVNCRYTELLNYTEYI